MAEKINPKTNGVVEVAFIIKVPMKRTGLPITSRRIDIQLTHFQAQALRDLHDGLNEKYALLKNGRPIERSYQALQWLLENITPEKAC